MSFLIAMLVKFGMGEATATRWAKPIGWALIAVGAIILVVIGIKVYNGHVVKNYQNSVAAHDAPIVRNADQNADQARTKDQQQISEDQRNEQDAIAAQPANGLSPKQRARACAILMRQARDVGGPRPPGC